MSQPRQSQYPNRIPYPQRFVWQKKLPSIAWIFLESVPSSNRAARPYHTSSARSPLATVARGSAPCAETGRGTQPDRARQRSKRHTGCTALQIPAWVGLAHAVQRFETAGWSLLHQRLASHDRITIDIDRHRKRRGVTVASSAKFRGQQRHVVITA